MLEVRVLTEICFWPLLVILCPRLSLGPYIVSALVLMCSVGWL